jgi:hypothetical protein
MAAAGTHAELVLAGLLFSARHGYAADRPAEELGLSDVSAAVAIGDANVNGGW